MTESIHDVIEGPISLDEEEMPPAEKAKFLRAIDGARDQAHRLDGFVHQLEDRIFRLAEVGIREGLSLNDIAAVAGLTPRALRLRLKRRAAVRVEMAARHGGNALEDGIEPDEWRTIRCQPPEPPEDVDPWHVDMDITDEGEIEWVDAHEGMRRREARREAQEEARKERQ